MTKFIGDIKYPETYTDKKTGEEKTYWHKWGALFEKDNGKFSIKMGDTWLQVLPPRIKEEQYQEVKQAVQQTEVKGGFEEEIPF